MPVVYPRDLTHEVGVDQMFDNDAGDKVAIVGRVQRPGTVNSVEYIPGWTMSGADTNSRTLSLYNRGPAGAGTTLVATLALTSGVNLTKFAAKVITLSATGANLNVAVGDVLQWESLHVGTGLPDPGGRVIVQQSLGS